MTRKDYIKPAIKTLSWSEEALMGPSASIVPPEVGGAKEFSLDTEDSDPSADNPTPSVWDN